MSTACFRRFDDPITILIGSMTKHRTTKHRKAKILKRHYIERQNIEKKHRKNIEKDRKNIEKVQKNRKFYFHQFYDNNPFFCLFSWLIAFVDCLVRDSPRRRACFLNSVLDCSPFKNSKNFQIFGCACPRIELIRRCQPSRKFVVLGTLPRVRS